MAKLSQELENRNKVKTRTKRTKQNRTQDWSWSEARKSRRQLIWLNHLCWLGHFGLWDQWRQWFLCSLLQKYFCFSPHGQRDLQSIWEIVPIWAHQISSNTGLEKSPNWRLEKIPEFTLQRSFWKLSLRLGWACSASKLNYGWTIRPAVLDLGVKRGQEQSRAGHNSMSAGVHETHLASTPKSKLSQSIRNHWKPWGMSKTVKRSPWSK